MEPTGAPLLWNMSLSYAGVACSIFFLSSSLLIRIITLFSLASPAVVREGGTAECGRSWVSGLVALLATLWAQDCYGVGGGPPIGCFSACFRVSSRSALANSTYSLTS